MPQLTPPSLAPRSPIVSSVVLCLSLYLSVASCSKSDSSTAPTGDLTITVTAPGGVTPQYFVSGPNGLDTVLTATATLAALPPGSYVVTAGPGRSADAIVSTAYAGAVSGSPATVTAGATANATVTYTSPSAASGRLYVSNVIGNAITAFTSAQLAASGAPAPAMQIGSGTGTSKVQGSARIAVDPSGGVWWVNNTDTVFYYSAAQIASSTNAAPAVHIVNPAFVEAVAVALDRQGNLWVADQGNSTISEFTAAQIASSGTVAPVVVLSSVIGSIKRPYDITFDAHGDLWVANYGDSSVVGFSPAQLAATGAPVPFAGVSGSKGTAVCITIAFDSHGNLWIATLGDTITMFTPDKLTTLGKPDPTVILTGAVLSFPINIAFDNSGDLWVASYVGNKFMKIPAAQLAASGTVAPTVIITANGNSIDVPEGLAFSPPPANVPVW